MSKTKKTKTVWMVTLTISDTAPLRKHFTGSQIKADVHSALIDEFQCWNGMKVGKVVVKESADA